MPMTAAERHNVDASIQKILVDEIHGQFLDLYAAAVSLSERHPEQINNELRNALTHISRATALDDYALAMSEIKKAESHIERAKRDTAKVAVIELRDLISDVCADLRLLNGTVDVAFVIRRDDISKKRKAILKREAKGGAVINDFVALYLEADSLHDDLLRELNGSGRRLPRWRYRVVAWRRYLLGGIGGIAISVLAAATYSALAPDGQAFGNSIRQLVGIPLVYSAQPVPKSRPEGNGGGTAASPSNGS